MLDVGRWLLAHYRDETPPPALDQSGGASKSELLLNLEKAGAKVRPPATSLPLLVLASFVL